MGGSESICSVLGLKLGKSWEAYVSELPKLPLTGIFLTSLELDSLAEKPSQLHPCILHALYQGLCGLKSIDYNSVETCDEDMKVDPVETKFPENFARKEEEPV